MLVHRRDSTDRYLALQQDNTGLQSLEAFAEVSVDN